MLNPHLTNLDLSNLPDPLVLDRMLCEKNLGYFIRAAWPVLEPATVYKHGYHIDAIVDHLMAVSRGEIKRLLINIPPRCMKSLSVSVAWQVWEWIQRFWDADGNEIIRPGRGPYTRWLFASYAQALSTRDTLKARRVIKSDWYQSRWGNVFELAGDQNAKMRFENSKQGMRLATAVDAIATGEGGDLLVIDDPHSVRDAESEAVRESTLVWLDETMSTRFNDPKTGRQVIVMQRVHERDCSGHVLAQGGYEHLCLPMRFEPSRLVPYTADGGPNEDYTPPTSIGFVDPRTQEGDLLWEEHLDEAAVVGIETPLGPYAVAGQLQQRPSPRGGGMFKRKDFNFVDAVPEGRLKWVRSWDLAGTDPTKQASISDPDWTAGLLMAATLDPDPDIYLCDVVHIREDPGDRDETMELTAREDGREVPIWIEQEPGQSGKSQIVHFRKILSGYAVNPPQADQMPATAKGRGKIRETGVATGNKVQRAEPLATHVARGKVYIVRGTWNKVFLDEITKFPMSAHKDQVDAASQGYTRVTGTKLSTAQIMKLKGYFR